MPNLYFYQPRSRSEAILRAVLSLEDCERLFSPDTAEFLGSAFPALNANASQTTDFALLHMDTRTAGAWQQGFYRLDADLNELSRRLLFMSK